MAEWTPVEIEHIEPIGEPKPDRVELVFHLNCEPDPRWRDYFHLGRREIVGGSPGSSTMRKPEVIGSSIRMVAPASKGSTIHQVRAHVVGANQSRVIDAQ